MNGMYDIAVNAMIDGSLDLTSDDLWVRGYDVMPFYPWIESMADQPYPPLLDLDDQPLIDRNAFARSLTASDVTFPFLNEALILATLVIFRAPLSVGAPEMPIAYLDTRPDRMKLRVTGNGGPVTVAWFNGTVMTL